MLRAALLCLAVALLSQPPGIPDRGTKACGVVHRDGVAIAGSCAILRDDLFEMNVSAWLRGTGPRRLILARGACKALSTENPLLIFATAGDGGRFTCVQSQPLASAGDDAAVFAALRVSPTLVRGSVRLLSEETDQPLGGVIVRIKGERQSTQTLTDAEGTFAVYGLPAGMYELRLEHGNHRPAGSSVQLFGLGERDCRTLGPFYLERFGLVQRAVDALKAVHSYARSAWEVTIELLGFSQK